MEEGKQELPSGSSSMAMGERKISLAQLHALIACVLQLASEVGSEKSDRQDTLSESPILSLEQMVSRLHHLTATVAPHNKLGAEPRQPLAPSEDVQAPAKPLRGQAAERAESEPDRDCHPDETTMSEVVVGCHGLS
jgi:hypothetical protein